MVTIYSTPTCPYCVMAKDYFNQNSIPYKDINVAEDHNGAREMIEKSGQMGVPVIEINGKIIVGFNPGEIKKHL